LLGAHHLVRHNLSLLSVVSLIDFLPFVNKIITNNYHLLP